MSQVHGAFGVQLVTTDNNKGMKVIHTWALFAVPLCPTAERETWKIETARPVSSHSAPTSTELDRGAEPQRVRYGCLRSGLTMGARGKFVFIVVF